MLQVYEENNFRVMIFLLLFFVNIQFIQMIKLFTFNQANEESVSYAMLEESAHLILPKSFVLCTSHLETSIDGRSFMTIYGDDEHPWLAMSIWSYEAIPILFVSRTISDKTVWTRIMDIKETWLNFWIHICMHVDTETEILNVSINGEALVKEKLNGLNAQRPTNFNKKIYVGLSHQNRQLDPQQFVGSVTNINIFDGNTANKNKIQEMSKNLSSLEGSIISLNSIWMLKGNVIEEEEEDEKICFERESYVVAIPVSMGLSQGLDICKKLGNSIMTEQAGAELCQALNPSHNYFRRFSALYTYLGAFYIL